eukprot:1159143-Pelagomonas_calceolata.AAC.8
MEGSQAAGKAQGTRGCDGSASILETGATLGGLLLAGPKGERQREAEQALAAERQCLTKMHSRF